VVRKGEEPRRVLGFPLRARGGRGADDQPRVLGMPRGGMHPQALDLRGLAHPVRWWRWRRRVHRLGPYALGYDESDGAGDESA